MSENRRQENSTVLRPVITFSSPFLIIVVGMPTHTKRCFQFRAKIYSKIRLKKWSLKTSLHRLSMGPLKCGETIKTLSFPFHLLLLLLVLLATRLVFVACARQFIVDYFAINVVQKKKKKTRKSKYLKSLWQGNPSRKPPGLWRRDYKGL